MLGKALVIVNPAARHGVTGTLVPLVEGLLQGHADYQLVVTEYAGHATEIAREAEEFDTVVAVGGDGTVHEVLNGIMAISDARRPAIALLPTGSGNDYRRTLGLSNNLSTAARQIIGGRRKRMDLGVVNETYFANSVAIGLDARVTAKAVELKTTTGWSGIMLYMRALLIILFQQFYSHPMRLSFNGGGASKRDLLLVAVTNGPTYGGGFKITPGAMGDDGELDVCIIERVSLAGALWRLPFVVCGRHSWMAPVTLERHRSVLVESDTPIEGQIDGEVTLATVYAISIIPHGIEVIVPGRS